MVNTRLKQQKWPWTSVKVIHNRAIWQAIYDFLLAFHCNYDVTMPLQVQVVQRLGLDMINLHTKFELSMFTRYEDMKGNVKCRN